MRISDWSSDVCSSDLWSPAIAAFAGATNLFVLGRGYGLAAAQEAALKFKETCALHAEAFSAAEVRHGPMAIIGERFPILALGGTDRAGVSVCDAAQEFRARGAAVLLADPGGGGDRSEAHTSELQSLMRLSYAVFCLKNTNLKQPTYYTQY